VLTITSRQNPLVKRLRALHEARHRRAAGEFLLEGVNSVEAALAAGWPVTTAVGEEGQTELLEALAGRGVESLVGTPEVLTAIADSQTSPKIVAAAKLPVAPTEWDLTGMLLVIDGVADPGNVGTLLRAADAAGVEKVILTAGSADPWSPKVVRSAAGSLLHLPPLELKDRSPAAIVAALREREIAIFAAEAHDGIDCYEFAWPERGALVLGHETRGISAEFQEAGTARVTIPVYGRAESLNAAMAGTLLMYAWRQSLAERL
jgi:TrmH family RNA methyltransferase